MATPSPHPDVTRGVLARRVAAFVRGTSDERFTDLAWAVHQYQRATDPVLAAFAPDGSATGDWTDVPAVPVALFRDPGVGRRAGAARVFRTSGTTSGARGEHHLRDTVLYDLSARRWVAACVPGLPSRVVALLEDPARRPDSSLSHMVSLFGTATWHVTDGAVAPDLRVEGDAPVFLPATAFALAEWLERAPPPLPPGSVVMITGGYKGRIRSIDAAALVQHTRRVLAPARVVLEYGMTELVSQLWGAPGAAFLPPPWLRVVAVDPEGRPLPAGTAGQLRFVDLCALDGAVAIETMDLGSVGEDSAVTLRGRLPDAPLRGCSLPVEEAALESRS